MKENFYYATTKSATRFTCMQSNLLSGLLSDGHLYYPDSIC